jgi:hypothetical protein
MPRLWQILRHTFDNKKQLFTGFYRVEQIYPLLAAQSDNITGILEPVLGNCRIMDPTLSMAVYGTL